jgi:hypothetical protein
LNPLPAYAALRGARAAMLRAAAAGDWQAVAAAERDCAGLVEALSAQGEATLAPLARARRLELIRQALADGDEVRRLAEERRRALAAQLEEARNARKLGAAYGTGS